MNSIHFFKQKWHLCLLSLASSLLVLTPSIAPAQELTATFVGYNGLTSLQNQTGTFNGTDTVHVTTGAMRFSGPEYSFRAYCADPLGGDLHYMSEHTFTIADKTTLRNYALIELLIGGYMASAKTVDDATAVGWAVWEMVQESTITSPYSLSDGNVHIDNPSSIATLANTYLANVHTFTPVPVTFLKNNTGGQQDIVAWDFKAVPEPSSTLLVLIGTLGAIMRRKR